MKAPKDSRSLYPAVAGIEGLAGHKLSKCFNQSIKNVEAPKYQDVRNSVCFITHIADIVRTNLFRSITGAYSGTRMLRVQLG